MKKKLLTLNFNDQNLTVLIQEIENLDKKAACFYFVNGDEITDWKTLGTLTQELFTSLSDAGCKALKLDKWTY